MIRMDIRDMIKIKEERKISWETVAREIGVTLQTVFRWVKNKSLPSPMAVTIILRWVEKNKKFLK
jgi:DNA-binding transcriptional regulator YiaG